MTLKIGLIHSKNTGMNQTFANDYTRTWEKWGNVWLCSDCYQLPDGTPEQKLEEKATCINCNACANKKLTDFELILFRSKSPKPIELGTIRWFTGCGEMCGICFIDDQMSMISSVKYCKKGAVCIGCGWEPAVDGYRRPSSKFSKHGARTISPWSLCFK